jgi:hypothetical protein
MIMKNTLISSKPRTVSLNRTTRRVHSGHRDHITVSLTSRTDQNRIKWPTEHELQQVATALAKVSRTGKRQEDAGDYFTSGDLAYQVHEIIRTTANLLKRSRRINS